MMEGALVVGDHAGPRKRRLESNNDHHIPVELVIQILSSLPTKSLMRFKCVSKDWLLLINDLPQWNLYAMVEYPARTKSTDGSIDSKKAGRRRKFYVFRVGGEPAEFIPATNKELLSDNSVACYVCAKNWVVTVTSDWKLSLVNIVAGEKAFPLPDLNPQDYVNMIRPNARYNPNHAQYFLGKFIMYGNPLVEGDECILVVMFHTFAYHKIGNKMMAFCTPKVSQAGKNWNWTPIVVRYPLLADGVFHDGKFLVTSRDVRLEMFNIKRSVDGQVQFITEPFRCIHEDVNNLLPWPSISRLTYLVSCDKDLYLVFCYNDSDVPTRSKAVSCSKFRVYQLILNDTGYHPPLQEVQTLGNRVFFLGENSSYALEVGHHFLQCGVQPNCIYYTCHRFHGYCWHDMGVCQWDVSEWKGSRCDLLSKLYPSQASRSPLLVPRWF